MTPRFDRRAQALLGLLLLGQGLLVLTGVLDHEVPRAIAAGLVLAGGALLAWPALRRTPAGSGAPSSGPPVPALRARLVAALGLAILVAVAGYEASARNGLGLPEASMLAYGAALVAAAGHLGRTVRGVPVGTMVAYSFPLVLAPLALWAVNAATTAQAVATPLGWYVRHALAAPMAAVLGLAGLDVATSDTTLRIATERGSLFLSVGVVCAGLYAGVLFLGVFGLFAWQARTPPRRLAGYLALGLAGLHLANLGRLVVLGLVGERWGGAALQFAHEHLGWVLFLVWTLLFWMLVLRRLEGPAPGAAGGGAA